MARPLFADQVEATGEDRSKIKNVCGFLARHHRKHGANPTAEQVLETFPDLDGGRELVDRILAQWTPSKKRTTTRKADQGEITLPDLLAGGKLRKELQELCGPDWLVSVDELLEFFAGVEDTGAGLETMFKLYERMAKVFGQFEMRRLEKIETALSEIGGVESFQEVLSGLDELAGLQPTATADERRGEAHAT